MRDFVRDVTFGILCVVVCILLAVVLVLSWVKIAVATLSIEKLEQFQTLPHLRYRNFHCGCIRLSP